MKNEKGRSMVEMLGVLAIIGVLSVAGIAGYTMAMNKYKANEILNAASQLHMLAIAADGGNGAAISSDDGAPGTTAGGATLCAKATGDVEYTGIDCSGKIKDIVEEGKPSHFTLSCVTTLSCS